MRIDIRWFWQTGVVPARLLRILLLACATGCTRARQPAPEADNSRGNGLPPRAWEAGIAFYLPDSARAEFFDGARIRVVTSDELQGAVPRRTAWYRVRTRGTLRTTLRVRVEFPGAGVTVAEYPLTVERRAFYSVYVTRLGYHPRVIITAREPRAYPLPPGVQTGPADSLWIFWAARGRDCWSCPG